MLDMLTLLRDHRRWFLPSYNIQGPSYHTRSTARTLSWCDSGAGRVAEGWLDGAVDAIDSLRGVGGVVTVGCLFGIAVDAVNTVEAIESRYWTFGTAAVHRSVCVFHSRS